MKHLYVTTRSRWRNWLAANHDKVAGIWLIFYRKVTGRASLDYDAAVEEALCYGWIDSIIKKVDETRYVRKFTPRKDNSVWSETNKKRVARMTEAGRMTRHGLARIEAAKKNGRWYGAVKPKIALDMPKEFARALDRSKQAKQFFKALAPTYRKHYVIWISMARRKDTRKKRIRESISLLEQGRKLGLK